MQLKLRRGAEEFDPAVHIGGLPIEAANVEETAEAFIAYCQSTFRHRAPRPLFSTSVNGQVLSLSAQNPELANLLRQADSINADGQPIVLLSRLLCRRPLPARVATTDLYPAVAYLAARSGLTFYLLGASEEANRAAVARSLAAHPGLRIIGRRNGYFSIEDEPSIVEEIAGLAPDVLWVALGAPMEHQFCVRNLNALRGVGIVKTSGGLFDFLALAKPRAPMWMQHAGLEWLFRLGVEPRRLFLRYLLTSPHALFVMARDMR
jgi:N-acetylglucosaminyldiphosphoundecaprenol N-acetyl-beta-D-mannosaminyltransferase